MLKPILFCAGLLALVCSSASAAPEQPSKIEVLHQSSSAQILMCEMKIKIVALNAEMGQATPGQSESTRRICANEAEAAIQEQLSPVKEALKDKSTATSNLKDWYSAWMAALENLPLSGRAIDEGPLDEKMKKVVVEASW